MNSPFVCPPSRARSRRRPGFSLLELLVAIILVDVALLAIVQTNAAVLRGRNEMRARAAAVAASAARVEQLVGTPCVVASGMASGPLIETWLAQPIAGGRELSDSVVFGFPRSHFIVLRTRTPC